MSLRYVAAALMAALTCQGASAQCGLAGCSAPGVVARVTATSQVTVRSGAIRQRYTPLANAVSNAQARHQARKERRGR
jgi:hypothetical protein